MKKKINDQIESVRVRVVKEDGSILGVFLKTEAIQKAEDVGLDLVQMNDVDVPICKIIDYSKYIFNDKKLKKKNNKTKKANTKQLTFRPNTDLNDIVRLLKQAQRFVDGGDYVKFIIRFKGREVTYLDKSLESFKYISDNIVLPTGYKITTNNNIENRRIFMLISK